jgi:hypothetical protein
LREKALEMKKLRFLLSLTNDDNDYQIEQTSAAQQAASNCCPASSRRPLRDPTPSSSNRPDRPRIPRLSAPPPPLALESCC